MDGRDPSRWGTRAIPARVLTRVLINKTVDPSGCWISNYSVASHGYAQIGWGEDGTNYIVTAHRAAWTAVNGPIPVGMTVDHTCRVRPCVNPAHLRLLPNVVNATDNGRTAQRVSVPTGRLCRKGHPLVINPTLANAKAFCLECKNRSAAARRLAAASA